MRIACARCGALDGTLRVAVFTFVASFLVLSVKRPVVGLHCAPCRRIRAIQNSLATVFLGWWGFPWGPIWSVESIVRNARGGELPPAANAALLDEVARVLRERGEQFAASEAAEEGRRFAAAAEVAAAKAARPWWQRPFVQVAFGLLALAFVAAIVTGAVAGPAAPQAAAPPAASSVTTADFSLDLPAGWYRVDIDPARIDASLTRLERAYGITDTGGLRERVNAGAKLVAVYLGAEVALSPGRRSPVLMVTLDRYTGAGGLRAVLDGMTASLARDTRFRPLIKTTTTMPAGPMGLVAYEPNPPATGPQVRQYVFYREGPGTIYFLRFDMDAVLQDPMQSNYTTILRSFQPAK